MRIEVRLIARPVSGHSRRLVVFPAAQGGERALLPVVIERFASGGQSCLPVVGQGAALVGVISFAVVQQASSHRAALTNLISARDLATPPVTVTGDQSLYSAFAKMSSFDSQELLVVDRQDSHQKVIAILTSGDINAIYDEHLLDPPQPEPGAGSGLARFAKRWLPKSWPRDT
jgi:CBS domain-containing protein